MLEDFDSRKHLGFLCDCVSREIKKAVGRGVCEINADTCNVKNGWLLGFLVRQTEPVFQKDLEKLFHLPKSTLADIVLGILHQVIEIQKLIEELRLLKDIRCYRDTDAYAQIVCRS